MLYQRKRYNFDGINLLKIDSVVLRRSWKFEQAFMWKQENLH